METGTRNPEQKECDYHMDEQRKHGRTRAQAAIKLSHDSFGTIWVGSRDISDGGIFVIREPGQVLPLVGTVLNLTVSGVMAHELPEIQAEVVRADDDGIGIRFMQAVF